MKALGGNWNLTTGPMLHAVLAACCSTDRSRIMPALAVVGVRWHIASDDVPLFATFGSAFHAIWILVILLTSQSILNMPNQCHHEGRQYMGVNSDWAIALLHAWFHGGNLADMGRMQRQAMACTSVRQWLLDKRLHSVTRHIENVSS